MVNKKNTLSHSDPIRHVVLLMLENHSFDQMLGCFTKIYPDLEGVNLTSPHFNLDQNGKKIFQTETTERQMPHDPNHDCTNVIAQLESNNSGFLKDFVSKYPKSSTQEHEYIMGYYPLDFLPALHALARDFTICDHWFSSVPGPTWPNRFFALSGTSSGRVKMPEGVHLDLENAIFDQNQKTIFDCLNEGGKTWKVYYYDCPLSLVLTHQREPENLMHYRKIEHFFADVAGPEKEFPDFTFIEPKYMGVDQNDDHPPHNTMKAEKLIADIYNAIRSNSALWESTLLVVLYDEHGGFYDHVSPPNTIPPDAHHEEYTFDRLGVRVPALLVSPWVKKCVEKTVFDHTSLLKYLIDKWQLNALGERTAQATSIATALCFDEQQRCKDTVSFIRVPGTDLISPLPELEKCDTSSHHKAIYLFADFLASQKNLNVDFTHVNKMSNPLADFKAKVGKAFIKVGKWLEQASYQNNKNRIDHTCEVVENVIKSK